MRKKQIIDQWNALCAEAKLEHRSKPAVLVKMVADYLRYGVYPSEYYAFGFNKKSSADKKTYLLFQENKRLIRKLNNRWYIGCLADKYIFSVLYADLYRRPCYRTDLLRPEELERLFSTSPRVIFKPLALSQGRGITVFDTAEKTAAEIMEQLRSFPLGIVEGWIQQSEEMNRVYADTVNCIRVVSVLYQDKVYITGSTFSVGTHRSHVANADAGAVFAVVDENTGKVLSDYICYDDIMKPLETHPDTGMRIKGYQIERWDEVRALVEKAARRIPQMGIVSWDIAMREDGPILIEGNTSGGYKGYQLASTARDGKGTKPKYQPFL